MKTNPHHITVGDEPWCRWTGCQAGRDIQQKAGDHTCGHTSLTGALRAAQALRPHFKRGRVKVVQGRCPDAVAGDKVLEDFRASAG